MTSQDVAGAKNQFEKVSLFDDAGNRVDLRPPVLEVAFQVIGESKFESGHALESFESLVADRARVLMYTETFESKLEVELKWDGDKPQCTVFMPPFYADEVKDPETKAMLLELQEVIAHLAGAYEDLTGKVDFKITAKIPHREASELVADLTKSSMFRGPFRSGIHEYESYRLPNPVLRKMLESVAVEKIELDLSGYIGAVINVDCLTETDAEGNKSLRSGSKELLTKLGEALGGTQYIKFYHHYEADRIPESVIELQEQGYEVIGGEKLTEAGLPNPYDLNFDKRLMEKRHDFLSITSTALETVNSRNGNCYAKQLIPVDCIELPAEQTRDEFDEFRRSHRLIPRSVLINLAGQSSARAYRTLISNISAIEFTENN